MSLILSLMEKVALILKDSTVYREKGSSLIDFFRGEGDLVYEENPIIAALVNGEFRSLDYTLIHKSTRVEGLRLFSPLGKRVYRHSICFLLSAAAARLFPQRHLEIGHSLGDGFYFRFTDAPVKKKEKEALEKEMRALVEARLPIRREKIAYLEALSLFGGRRSTKHAAQLLESRNDGDITVYTLEDFMDLSYEPLVTNTSVLSLWKLQIYDKGLLLRYPQSRDWLNIKDFQDNPLLFSVFKNTMKENKILSCESLGELNRIIMENEYPQLISLSEAMFNKRVGAIADDIRRKKAKIVYIAGPSSSGKTTFSLKLSLQLRALGCNPLKISLDDYYFSRDKVPVDEDGNKDYEALEAIDTAFFQENILDLLTKGKTLLPRFSFKENRRYMAEKETMMNDSTVMIIEGIHGLNPELSKSIDQALTYRIYISALTSMIIDDHNRISTTDNRIIRRLVRDYRTRGVRTEETLGMWASVERGEKNHIFPYQNNADAMINSAMPYELAALCPFALNLLRSVKPDNEVAYATARRLLKFLELIYSIPVTTVPKDSITREFLGGSVFETG